MYHTNGRTLFKVHFNELGADICKIPKPMYNDFIKNFTNFGKNTDALSGKIPMWF